MYCWLINNVDIMKEACKRMMFPSATFSTVGIFGWWVIMDWVHAFVPKNLLVPFHRIMHWSSLWPLFLWHMSHLFHSQNKII